jgi:hypothetical protein
MPYNNPKSFNNLEHSEASDTILGFRQEFTISSESNIQKVFGSFGMAACRKWNRNLRIVKKGALPFFTVRGYRSI